MLLFVVARVPIVPVVHKHVQQRTQEEQRIRQEAEDVRSVFDQEEESGDG